MALAAVIALGGLAAIPRPAEAIWGYSDYTYGSSSCSSFKDPVNFYYSGTGVGEASSALWLVEQGLGLTGSWPASDQWVTLYLSGGFSVCSVQNYNRKQGAYHTRIKGTQTNSLFGPMSAGPIHTDRFVLWPPCGDVAGTFNGARDWARNKYLANAALRLSFSLTFAGNTASITQCDGTSVASDGWVYRGKPK